MKNFIRNHILKTFFEIALTSVELTIAEDSVNAKYYPALAKGIIKGLIILPAILLLDTSTIISVLIPVTLVAGTAWFSISLANIKKKFEHFGMELTIDIFDSFVTSLIILILISAVSLLSEMLNPFIVFMQQFYYIKLVSALLGIFVISNIIYKIFIGALKFDANDSMLAGQNEAAEKYFKKSLSFLQITANSLRDGKSLQVANYYIGLSFFEIFTYIQSLKILPSEEIEADIAQANILIDKPTDSQEIADEIGICLIKSFLSKIKDSPDKATIKSIGTINDELRNLSKKDSNENQEMVDTRMSIIFQEIGEMIDNSGESLFVKN